MSSLPPHPAIEEVDYTSPSDFLDALGRRAPAWQPNPSSWVFRGHSDADAYELLPCALRAKDVWVGAQPGIPEGRRSTHQDQIQAESEVLWEYLSQVDGAGLPVPEDGQWWRSPEGYTRFQQDMLKPAIQGNGFWPPEGMLSWVALAQHFGVPTRLLDWTASPHTGAYFAAYGGARKVKGWDKIGTTSHISIWALNLDYIWEVWDHGLFDRSLYSLPRQDIFDYCGLTLIRVVTAPRSSNPNLRAQEGLFTLVHSMCGKPGDPPSTFTLDELVRQQHDRDQARGGAAKRATPMPVMRHLRLPIQYAPELLRLLYHERTSAARLFPGFEGAAKAVQEILLWDRLP